MADFSTIIIPINVQAVRVLEEDKSKFKGPTVNFSLIGGSTLLGEQIDQNLPSSVSPITEGVHLHWSLPDSLTHGVHDPASDSIVFPAVPNRWLVTRYFQPEDGGIGLNANALAQFQAHGVCVNQWIIESNRLLDSNSAEDQALFSNMMTSVPALEGTSPGPSGSPLPLPFNLPNSPTLTQKLLGSLQTFDNNWSDGEANNPDHYEKNLNAISYYGPGFAAYYQNSSSVFGFSDDFADLGYGSGKLFGPKFKVSYQLIGWFGDSEANDIVALLLPKAQQAYQKTNQKGSKIAYWAQFLQAQLKWQASTPVQSQAGDAWPSSVQSIYNGVVFDIVWKPTNIQDQEFLPQPAAVADSLNLELALGNNSAEAISALISIEGIVKPEGDNDNEEPYPVVERHVELLFNAFQQDLLRRLAGTDPGFQLPQIEEYLHNRRYSARNGGTIWTVRPAGQTDDQSKGTGQVPLAQSSAELLSSLNAAQQTYDRQIGALHSRQLQAYLDWTRWGLAISSNGSNAESDKARAYIESELLQIFTESGLSGELAYSEPDANGNRSLQFQPVWTAPNSSVAGMMTQLASAENTLRITFSQAFQALQAVVLNAQATYTAGDPTGALQIIQALTSNQAWQDQWSALQNVLTNNSLAGNLNKAVNTDLVQLATNLKTALQSNASGTGLSDIVAIFQSGNDGSQQLGTFMSAQQSLLFNTTNLVDTQQVWLYLEAANYDAPTSTVSVAKILSAQTALQNAINDLQNLVNPALSGALFSVNQAFPLLNKQLADATAQVQTLSQDLGKGLAAGQDFTNLLQTIQTALVSTNVQHSCATALRQAWQSLLGSLPTGHQVVLLLGALADAVGKINNNSIVQPSTADPYWLPTDPVVVITQPDSAAQSLLPVNRNGAATLLPYRLPSDLLSGLAIKIGNQNLTIDASALSQTALPTVIANSNLGAKSAVMQALLVEGYLSTPQTAQDVLVNAGKATVAEVPGLQDVQIQVAEKLAADQTYLLAPPVENGLSFSSTKGSSPLTATFNGVAPYYIGLNYFDGSKQYPDPFLPLYLAWTADFDTIRLSADDGTSMATDFLTTGFALDADHVDLTYGIKAQPPLRCSDNQRAPQSLSGQVTLSTRSADNLLNQIRVYFQNTLSLDIAKGPLDPGKLQNDFQKNLSGVYEYFRKKTILSQGLNGFNAGLALQLALLQTPLNNIDDSDVTATPLFTYLQETWKNNPQWNRATVGPDANNIFLPIRAGRLRLRELYIVDAFGRYFSLGSDAAPIQQQIALAAGLSQIPGDLLVSNCNGAGNETKPNDAYLPPRLIQPARLAFDWLSASANEGGENTFVERTNSPAFSPITGWILPNHLDDSLGIYDAGGNALGALGIEGTKRQLTWRSVPSQAGQDTTDNGRVQMLKDINGANSFLQDFLQKFAFPEAGNPAFQDFLNAIDQSQQFIHTNNLLEDKGLAVLIGRPLVLVRAYMRLEVLGLPNVDLSSAAFKQAVDTFAPDNQSTWMDYDYSTRRDAGFNELAVPVDLGDLHQFDDGLVGFFLGNDWSTFYTPVSNKKTGAVQQSGWGSIQLLPNADNRAPSLIPPPPNKMTAGTPMSEIVLTMVMDPRAAIHASSGILPVKSIGIPAEQYRPILKKLIINFLSNPVLVNKQNLTAGGQSFSVPLPAEKGYDWSWVQPGVSDTPLEPNQASDRAQFPTTPNEMLDGWLKLQPNEK